MEDETINMREQLILFCTYLFTEMKYTTDTRYTPEEQVDVYIMNELWEMI